jgi:hypothetical protein
VTRAERSLVGFFSSQHAYSSIRLSPILIFTHPWIPITLADHTGLPRKYFAASLSRMSGSMFNSGGDDRPTSAAADLGGQLTFAEQSTPCSETHVFILLTKYVEAWNSCFIVEVLQDSGETDKFKFFSHFWSEWKTNCFLLLFEGFIFPREKRP